jgi:prepilin-type N-terminal cleavage/methylation domain-containing protein
MQTTQTDKRGVTLIELLVTIAVLSLVLAGIYGLLTSAYQSYNHSRAKLESQQTARIVLDYLVYRLREVDGGSSTTQPERCTSCHFPNMDQEIENNLFMPCTTDVTIPQKAPMILEFREDPLPALPAGIPVEFQNMTGNYIKFQADLLPLHGFNESFTDSPSGATANGKWDWTAGDATTDLDLDGLYDRGEPELIEDMNDNSQYDYFGEIWTFKLRKSEEGPYYELVESLNFTSLEPRKRIGGRLIYNRSVYSDSGYTSIPVAYGITGLWIKKVPRISQPSTATGATVSAACYDSSNATACHGSTPTGTAQNIYGNATNMNLVQFIATHPFWDTGGLSIEVTTTDTKGQHQQFTKLREFVNFRNLEINQ